jgi:hypothetical protein
MFRLSMQESCWLSFSATSMIESKIPNLDSYHNMFFMDKLTQYNGFFNRELFDDTVNWLAEFPDARMDVEIALKHYVAGNNYGIIENIYKALENVAQKVTGIPRPLHESELTTALFSMLNVSDAWRQFLIKFVKYANDYTRHGKQDNRYASDPDEIESFLFLALIVIRMIRKKEVQYLTAPIDRTSLLKYLDNSRLVQRIENNIISINPKLKILEDRSEMGSYPVPSALLKNISRLGLRTIGDIDAIYRKYEKELVFNEQKEAVDAEADYYVKGFSIISLINYIYK